MIEITGTIVVRCEQKYAPLTIAELELKGFKLKKRHDYKNGRCIFSMTKEEKTATK